jgi:hypothetical protein
MGSIRATAVLSTTYRMTGAQCLKLRATLLAPTLYNLVCQAGRPAALRAGLLERRCQVHNYGLRQRQVRPVVVDLLF